MSINPFITIVTVCYNSEKTIERTIKSVLSQQFTDYEYLIVDGVSKDTTLSIIQKYEPLFNGHMKWRSEPDKGIGCAINFYGGSTGGGIRQCGFIQHVIGNFSGIEGTKVCFISGNASLVQSIAEGRDCNGDQNADDRNNDQHFHQGEALFAGLTLFQGIHGLCLLFSYIIHLSFTGWVTIR